MTEAPHLPPGFGLYLKRDMAKVYGKRGGLARASIHRWYVEGENLTTTEISKRLSIPRQRAERRVRSIRNRGVPITWSALKLEKQT